MSKRALIFRISGQDGSYLANRLLAKGYAVFGASRDAELSFFYNLCALGMRVRLTLLTALLRDFRSIIQVIKGVNPHQIYSLSRQGLVRLPFSQLIESVATAIFNILESIPFLSSAIGFFNAGSSQCHRHTVIHNTIKETSNHPHRPYITEKTTAHWVVANYRETYHLFCIVVTRKSLERLMPGVVRGMAEA
jgi:GDPmannose 4,6-dehydratase